MHNKNYSKRCCKRSFIWSFCSQVSACKSSTNSTCARMHNPPRNSQSLKLGSTYQRFRSGGKGRLNPPLLFIYCLGCLFVTALTPLTSAPGTGFPLVESNPTGIPNFFIISISSSSPLSKFALFISLLLSLLLPLSFFCCCSFAISSTESDTALSSVEWRCRLRGGSGDSVRWRCER